MGTWSVTVRATRRGAAAEKHLRIERLLHRCRDRAPGPVGAVGEPVQRAQICLGRKLAPTGKQLGVLRADLAIDVAVAAAVLLVSRALVLAVLVRDLRDLKPAPALLERAQAEVPVLIAVDGGIEAAGVLPAAAPDQTELCAGDRAVQQDVGVEVGEAQHPGPG